MKSTILLQSMFIRKQFFETLLNSIVTYLNAGVGGAGSSLRWAAEQNVLGLQVSVEDAFALQNVHGLSDLL